MSCMSCMREEVRINSAIYSTVHVQQANKVCEKTWWRLQANPRHDGKSCDSYGESSISCKRKRIKNPIYDDVLWRHQFSSSGIISTDYEESKFALSHIKSLILYWVLSKSWKRCWKVLIVNANKIAGSWQPLHRRLRRVIVRSLCTWLGVLHNI